MIVELIYLREIFAKYFPINQS